MHFSSCQCVLHMLSISSPWYDDSQYTDVAYCFDASNAVDASLETRNLALLSCLKIPRPCSWIAVTSQGGFQLFAPEHLQWPKNCFVRTQMRPSDINLHEWSTRGPWATAAAGTTITGGLSRRGGRNWELPRSRVLLWASDLTTSSISNVRMKDEWWIGLDLEGNCSGLR
jgi:hypothetical protein